MIARRAFAIVLLTSLLAGCAVDASGQANDQADELELAVEAVPFVSRGQVFLSAGVVRLSAHVDVPTDTDYLDTVERIIAVGAESPLADRKMLGIKITGEGTLTLWNVDPEDLESVLAAARISWQYASDGASLDATLVGDELFAELHVTDEHLVASALEELTDRVESEGLLHRPGGLEVRVSS